MPDAPVEPVVPVEPVPVVAGATPEAVPLVPVEPVVPVPGVPVAPVVPDTYDLKLPDGSTVDAAVLERTAAIARELGLTNEAAQKLADQSVKDETTRLATQQADLESRKPGGVKWTEQQTQWIAEAKQDPELGKTPEEFTANLEMAKNAFAKWMPELNDFLNETGLGSHPLVLKGLLRIGKASQEPGLVIAPSTAPARVKSPAETMFPSMFNDDGTPKVNP